MTSLNFQSLEKESNAPKISMILFKKTGKEIQRHRCVF